MNLALPDHQEYRDLMRDRCVSDEITLICDWSMVGGLLDPILDVNIGYPSSKLGPLLLN